MSDNIRVGVIGGAGYTAGELLRILLHHPRVTVTYVHSTSNAEKLLTAVHKDLIGDTDLRFSSEYSFDCDALFLCTGHGESSKFVSSNEIPDHVRLIDLSQDFRYSENSDFVYGLPELYRNRIVQHKKHIANPGCFATAIQLALLPLASAHHLQSDIHITGITGSTGAGQSLSPTSHYSWRSNNIQVYKPFTHQHCREIKLSLEHQQKHSVPELLFVPIRGNFTRGIHVSASMKVSIPFEDVRLLFRSFYESHPFAHILEEGLPDLKMVINTNKCIIGLEYHNGTLLIVSVIDNLIKGASGQAVQNMNLLFGLPETTGLQLKATGF